MTSQNVIETLRTQATSDPVTNAVLHMWALRKRTRNEVTINGLASKMKKEGFHHSRDQYVPLLRLMSTLGLGKLQTNHRGRVVALKQVETTLQSLGRAVLDGKQPSVLRHTRKKNRFAPIALHSEAKPPVTVSSAPAAVKQRQPISITVEMGEKIMTFPIDAKVSEEEAGYMVGKFIKFLGSL